MMPTVDLRMRRLTIVLLSVVVTLSCHNHTVAAKATFPFNMHFEHVASEFNVPGGYFAIKSAGHDALQGRQRADLSCHEFARSVPEPYSDRYLPKTSLPSIKDDDGVLRAYWQWNGSISRADFERAKLRKIGGPCFLNHYRIQKGRLFIEKGASLRVPETRKDFQLAFEEMLNVVLYLYPSMPDMEFLLFWSDDCVNGLPVLAPNVCRQYANAGFTLPSNSVLRASLGQVQMAAYHSCLWNRYPPHARKPLAVWRGTLTGSVQVPKEQLKSITRVKLHLLSENHSNIIDAKINRFPSWIPEDLRSLIHLGDHIHSEDYNSYSAIIDVDGNGWSDRFGNSLIHYATPIIKMATNRTAFFEHLFAPGKTFLQFGPSMEDLVDKAGKLVSDVQHLGGKSEYFDMVRAMQGTSQILMDHVGIAEAFAYLLLKYWSLVTWTLEDSHDPGHRSLLDPTKEQNDGPGRGDGDGLTVSGSSSAAAISAEVNGFEEVAVKCCSFTHLPAEFATAVTMRLSRKEPVQR
ncbi:hypothetical protein Vafri_20053 [Volvox africanus]|uniref:Glycosyl transferase CAP10 domain-containing protein n=1 Tax=Volvox africanus TaxID=51714 RepID=A0A8J4FA25_9CHLO|nr:hypothetical protein Vafri_20053 [Volvox africanus]